MNVGREWHCCGQIRGKHSSPAISVVAIGGLVVDTDGDFAITDKVEFLKLDTGTEILGSWSLGPKLPEKLARASSATTGSQQSIFVAGGQVDLDEREFSDRIYSLKCYGDAVYCHWTTESAKLIRKKAQCVAMVIPAALGFEGDAPGKCVFLQLHCNLQTFCSHSFKETRRVDRCLRS